MNIEYKEFVVIFSKVLKRRVKEAKEDMMTDEELDEEFEKAIAEEEALNKD